MINKLKFTPMNDSTRMFTPQENKLAGERYLMEFEKKTWEQKASFFANLNGRLMTENERLQKENDTMKRVLHNSEVMNKYYREKIEKMEKLVYSS